MIDPLWISTLMSDTDIIKKMKGLNILDVRLHEVTDKKDYESIVDRIKDLDNQISYNELNEIIEKKKIIYS